MQPHLWRFAILSTMSIAGAHNLRFNSSIKSPSFQDQSPFSPLYNDRPKDCPPCFNCNLDDFKCQQFGNCSQASGRCSCPTGFGGVDCSEPLCASPAHGSDRSPRKDNRCDCDPGWEGVNCNVCKNDEACNALMPEAEGGRCYTGVVQTENHQMCNITNRMIRKQLGKKIPQATFSCNAARKECNFQFWVDQRESFYCALDTCKWNANTDEYRNTTHYECENIKCRCIPGRMLCGESGSVDIGDFLVQDIKGPATFSSVTTAGNSSSDHSKFEEPAMNGLIRDVFGDESITLQCRSGECLYKTDVPGYARPIKTINTPLIAGVIAGCALLVVAVVLAVFFWSRRAATKYGPIHLSDDDQDDAAKLLADHKPAALHFEHISYTINGRPILNDISGAVQPGQLMAIMGASGAGKTTFLDILARKNKRGITMGDTYVNGRKIPDSDFRNVIGFVDQDDTMLPTLTVHEMILDSALLRLPRDMSRAAKEQKVDDVERQLGIHHIKDQIIGSEANERGISGGEKRRVAIACELVTSPSILFLDEPTSGLDAYNAYNVIECLVRLVKTYNRTVVFTIHQPRSNIVALFDQLILLASGRLVYSGPFALCQEYFDSIGYQCPPGFNIADYLIDLTQHVNKNQGVDVDDASHEGTENGIAATRASSVIAVKSVASISNVSLESPDVASRPKPSRGPSVRQQQERHLFTRRTSHQAQEPTTPRTTSSSIIDRDFTTQQWVKLSKQQQQQHLHAQRSGSQSSISGSVATDNLDYLVTSFAESEVASQLASDLEATTTARQNGDANGHADVAAHRVKGYIRPNLARQSAILAVRTWRNIYRNPLLMLTHYATAIILAVLIGYLFYGLTDDLKGFQNRLGFFTFVLALYGFSALSSLSAFAPERLLFVRERAKGYYHPSAYYMTKVLFDIIPLRLIPPLLMAGIMYPMTGLLPLWPEFSKFMLFVVLFNLAAATVCLTIGIVVREPGVASLVGVLFMLFSLLFGGFLLNHETIPKTMEWLQQVSSNYPFFLLLRRNGFCTHFEKYTIQRSRPY